MTVEAATANIDQGFFGFDRANGLSLVAGSFNLDGIGQAWTAQLQPHVRLSSSYGMPPPDSALAYLRLHNGVAAVVRRVNRGQYTGRNNSHVLVSSATILTPQLALGLAGWSGWLDNRPADGQMSRLRPEDLSDAAVASNHLRAQSLRHPDLLEKVLAWELQTGGKPLTIIGCPDEDRIGLLWGLLQLCGPALLAPPEWTFSTYEIEHADSIKYLPRIVFMPDQPDDTAVARRTVVDLTREQGASPPNEAKAKLLVSDYQDGTEVIPVYKPDPTEVSVPPPRPVEKARETVFQPSSANDQTRAPESSTQSSYVDTRWVSHQVKTLLNGSPQDAIHAHDVLWRKTAGGPDWRAAVRTALNAARWDVSKLELERQTEPRDLAERLDALLKLAFGNALVDLKSERGHNDALQLIETTSSEDLIRALAQLADHHGYLEQLASALGYRWIRPVPSTEPAPVPGGFIAKVLAGLGKPVTAGQERLIVAGLILLAIVTSFFVGCAAAGPEAPAQPTHNGVDSSSTPAPKPTPSSAVSPSNLQPAGALLGNVSQNNLQVWLTTPKVQNPPPWVVVKRNATLYPQLERCQRIGSDSTWLCDLKPIGGWHGGEEIIIVDAPQGTVFDTSGIPSLPAGSVELFKAQL